MAFQKRTAILFFAVSLTFVSTALSSDLSRVLSNGTSPHFISESIVVQEGDSLVLPAGTVLRFAANAGIEIRGGSFAIAGTSANPVILESQDSSASWKGISIAENTPVILRGVQFQNAQVAISMENGVLELENAKLENSKTAAIIATNSLLHIRQAEFIKNRTALLLAENSNAGFTDLTVKENKIGLQSMQNTTIRIHRAHFSENEIALFVMDDSEISPSQTEIKSNRVGVLSLQELSSSFQNSTSENQTDFSSDLTTASTLVPNLEKKPANAEQQRAWKLSGTLAAEIGYHLVFMRKNRTHEDFISGKDTVKKGDRYENYFQIPGKFGNWYAEILAETADGKTIEFSADLSSDSWDKFRAHSVKTVYTDKFQKITLGDFYPTAGEIYLSGLNVLGASYALNLFENPLGESMLAFEIFGGETKAPKYLGKKNYASYKDYIEEGEAEPQSMILGGSVHLTPIHPLNFELGFIGSKDYKEDPFIRDGMSSRINTVNPSIDSKTFYADVSWKFLADALELRLQTALGVADTADAAMQRAINQVFYEAGISVSDFVKLRELMNHPQKIKTLTRQELVSLFGDNVLLSPDEMRTELSRLITEAKKIQKEFEKEDPPETNLGDFEGQNLAFGLSLKYEKGNTAFEGYVKFLGDDFYSAGSPDQINNKREFGVSLGQKILEFWKLDIQYDLQIENAANESKNNIFGFGEGTNWGLFPDKNASWFDEHETDENRTHYIHTASLANHFDLTSRIAFDIRYAADYRTRNRPTRLYANYSASSGIYSDPWFQPSKKDNIIDVITEDDTLKIDADRFAYYYSLSKEPYLATRFEERLLKQKISAEIFLKLPHNDLRIGGTFAYRYDLSHFEKDSLIEKLDLSDKSFGILGYYFHGNDYAETSIPLSLTSKISSFRNHLNFMPRFKFYKAFSMREYEWNFSDCLEIELSKNFTTLFLEGSFREEIFRRSEENDALRELEIDAEGQITLRIHHSKALYSDWTLGTAYYYRPDNRSNEYKDFLGSASLHYEF